MGEPVYFYCMAFSTSISRSSVAGRKKIKKRITLAVTTNADGSFKMPLLFVSTAAELGFDYTNAAKGWMTTQLFRAWPEHFDEMTRSKECHVLLLLDNASSHRAIEHYSHATLRFLPPNATAHLQPQDAGIIKSFKSQLNRIRDKYVVYKLDTMLEQVDGVEKEDIDKGAE